MANPVIWDASTLPPVIAESIVSTANTSGQKINAANVSTTDTYLSDCICEITPETQTLGPALLQITLADPGWVIARSGICDMTPTGILRDVDVEYPPGLGVWWRLAMIDLSSPDAQPDQPNLTLTFQQRFVTYLMLCWKPLGWPGGKAGSTRAQFIKYLVDKLPKELPTNRIGPGGLPDVKFICPELNEVQPVASSNEYGTEVVTDQSAAAKAAGINKLPALTAATKITIKGQKPTSAQIQNLNTALGVAAGLNAPTVAVQAMVFAGIAETGFNQETNSSGHMGVWQSTHYAASDVTGAANGFLSGGPSFGGGGAIKLAKSGITDPIAIAEAVEVGGSYAGETGYSQFLPEAKAIVNAFDGGGLFSGASGISGTPLSDVAALTRGTPDNPDEDTWTCGQRLASEVNWMLFSSPSPTPGVFGDYLYYYDGPTLVAQKPKLYLELSADGTTWSATNPDTGKVLTGGADGMVTNISITADNSAYTYEQTTTLKAQAGGASGGSGVQSKTRIRTPQTPTQVMFNMFSGVLEFNAGDVAVFHDAGPANGRWILEDVTQNSLQDLFAQFTLGPPTYPYPEPQADTVTVTGADGQPTTLSTGSASSSSSGTSVSAVPVDLSGYTNPLQKLSSRRPLRIDQGVDYSGGGPILALGNATVVYAQQTGSGWPRTPSDPSGACVVIKLSDGPYSGKFVYVAENLKLLVSQGQSVKAGDPIATLVDAADNMEIGWASGSGSQTLAAALGQNGTQTGQSSDPGGVQSAAGRNFNALLVALGAVSGGPGSGPLSTGPGMPAGWPSLTAAAAKAGASAAAQAGKEAAGVFTSIFDRGKR